MSRVPSYHTFFSQEDVLTCSMLASLTERLEKRWCLLVPARLSPLPYVLTVQRTVALSQG